MVENLERITALKILNSYLSSTAVSPLLNTFVDVKEPLATTVSLDMNSKWETAIMADFLNVPVDKVDEIEPKFFEVINNILDNGPHKFDVGRIHTISKCM